MENEFIAWLRQRLPDSSRLIVGVGDDAAVFRPSPGTDTLLTVDVLTDGVDFLVGRTDPRRIGRKALAVNLSDIAAMAGRPKAALVGLVLPRHGGWDLALALYEGILPLAERYDLVIAGGDTNSWDGPLAISVTVIGETTPRGPLRRGGARPGDAVLVTGSLGGSILGKHLDFEPRVNEALLLAERYSLHSGIDISDGLALDLSRLLAESGRGGVLWAGDVPISDAARQLSAQTPDGVTPLEHALGDGEDFELLFTCDANEARRIAAEQPLEIPVTVIGEVTAEPGMWIIDHEGRKTELPPQGWVHPLD